MTGLIAYFVGLLFGVGLLMSGMTDANKVIGFLRFGAAWDPSLAFVMGGAILVHAPAYVLRDRWKSPLAASTWQVPEACALDRRLMIGAAVFGLGWGWAGYCPGPALVSVTSLSYEAVIFSISMIGAMSVSLLIDKNLQDDKSQQPVTTCDG